MPVKPDSRFANLKLLRATAPDGAPRQVIELRLRRPPTTGPMVAHRVTRGETIDLLARRYLGDERLWWRILDANPQIHPLDIAPGDTLNIPSPGPATRITRTRRF